MALTKQQQNMIAGTLLGVMAVGAFIWYIILPMNKDIDSKRGELKKLYSEISKLKKEAARIDYLKRENEILKLELKETEKSLPTSEELAGLIRYINEVSQIGGVSINSFKPMSKTSKQYFTEIPFAIDMDCNYHTLAQFLNTVNQAERIITASDLNMNQQSGKEMQDTIKASFQLVTYMAK